MCCIHCWFELNPYLLCLYLFVCFFECSLSANIVGMRCFGQWCNFFSLLDHCNILSLSFAAQNQIYGKTLVMLLLIFSATIMNCFFPSSEYLSLLRTFSFLFHNWANKPIETTWQAKKASVWNVVSSPWGSPFRVYKWKMASVILLHLFLSITDYVYLLRQILLQLFSTNQMTHFKVGLYLRNVFLSI